MVSALKELPPKSSAGRELGIYVLRKKKQKTFEFEVVSGILPA
jgi:hypothetical protein